MSAIDVGADGILSKLKLLSQPSADMRRQHSGLWNRSGWLVSQTGII